ncbi:MAG TPA: hypothetical protein VF188_17365, partial [Longimicrobiales bacterium]
MAGNGRERERERERLRLRQRRLCGADGSGMGNGRGRERAAHAHGTGIGGAMRRGWCVLPRICDLAAIAGVIAAAGCGAGDAALDARWAGVRDTVNGVEVVRNPATPLFGSAAAPCTCWTGWRGASCAA